jgi:hypothetical protein
MVVCPLCENSQALGSECDVCGRSFVEGAEVGPDLSPLEGLEPTQVASVELPLLAPMEELERTRFEPAPLAEAEEVPDLEATLAAPGEAELDPVPDLERVGDGIPDDEATPYPALVVCRYCRTEATFGDRICSRCGMRLPSTEPLGGQGSSEEAPRLCSCGAPVRGARCPVCGARAASE